jgi:predicted MFS family arabinose efflux permease
VLAVAFVEGSLGVFFGPAESASVRQVVAPEQRREAIARNQSRWQLAGLIGPPLGGALLGAGRALPFVADAVSYLVSLVAVLFARPALHDEPVEASGRHPLAEVFDGVRWLWGRPFLRALVVWMAFATLAFGSIGLVILVLARDHGASPAALGVMFALTSAGGVAGALATPRLTERLPGHTIVVVFAWTFVATTLLLLTTHSPYLLGVLGALTFFLVPALSALLFASIAANAPDHLQGRAVSGAIQLASLTGPIAPLAAGLLVGRLGTHDTILVYAAFTIAVALGATLSRGLRQPD